jgi:hypothetical protein
VIIDEWSEVQLHTWAELARWKLVGVIFILVGDADGQRKPCFDRWQDAMQSKDIRQSRLIWDICGGLRLNLAKNRRSSGDKDLFRRFTGMYDNANANEFLPSYVAKWMEKYPYDDRLGLLCEHYFVVSHKLRMDMNRLTNYHLAERHKPVLFLPAAGKLHGVTMQPQNMIIWKGMELLCCARRYTKKMPVSGAVYVVDGWDAKGVHLSLHEAYRGEKVTADDKPVAPLPKDVDDDEEEPLIVADDELEAEDDEEGVGDGTAVTVDVALPEALAE